MISESTFVMKVPLNAEVDLLEEGAEWSKIQYKGKTGYMMTKYLVPVASDEPPEEAGGLPIEGEPYDPSGEMITVQMPLTLAVELYSLLDQAIGEG